MKKAMIDYMKKEKNDELYTPEYAMFPLLKYLPSGWISTIQDDWQENKLLNNLGDDD